MSVLNYPLESAYKHPKKNILVISCMDLRLTDNLVEFLHFDNLQNRYDHFILAGASLLCSEEHKHHFRPGSYEKYEHWKKTLADHLELAVALHQIKDVYIVEHQDCGAYTELLDDQQVDLSTLEAEKQWHRKFSQKLAEEINGLERMDAQAKPGKEKYRLHVHCFFIDLRGNVELLYTSNPD
jgi:carbonic anhydrase